ncbi:hypothetical protein G8A07_00325 [Roseateles sp. DAIF2]|uniref:hypothetical protein n=1 Tax=Roseateles sp. DAIF2 TaxID=2714952 RepID=UPI0018A30C15|nr:hypothetical protein [Roseateles sp. DAIF2]QPF71516.1 hypothetical protein G8A07_00325 [Roseateles sp. DAIF2]
MADAKSTLELVAATVQVLSVVSGVVISVLSFNSTRQKEAEARALEAAKPFHDLRRSVYQRTIKAAATVANPDGHTAAEVAKARQDFRELYVAELAMVEDAQVEGAMVAFARTVDPKLIDLTPSQLAALKLAHALGASYTSQASLKP